MGICIVLFVRYAHTSRILIKLLFCVESTDDTFVVLFTVFPNRVYFCVCSRKLLLQNQKMAITNYFALIVIVR